MLLSSPKIRKKKEERRKKKEERRKKKIISVFHVNRYNNYI
jgi:hypothetical protein